VLYRQAPHQVDVVRSIAGYPVKKVRAIAGSWNRQFDTEGNFTAWLEFEDGTPATLVFNGYGFFDMTEMTWGFGEGGYASAPPEPGAPGPVAAVEPALRYAMPLRAEGRERRGERKQPFYGLTLVSCERGDMRQSPDGLYIYTASGREEVSCPPFLDRAAQLLKLYEAVTRNRSFITDGSWGKATLEVVLAILQSSREQREVTLSHQVSAAV
jgi:phthalate 4,5-cis-dihydrodiol dehydrogenase